MPEFTRRWNNFPTEQGAPQLTELTEPPYGSSVRASQGTFSGKTCSRPAPDAFSEHLLSRLQAGIRWLTAQHQSWLDDKKDAAIDERFSVALAACEKAVAIFYERHQRSAGTQDPIWSKRLRARLGWRRAFSSSRMITGSLEG